MIWCRVREGTVRWGSRAARLLAIALAASAAAGCSINKRTAEFSCETDADCDADRRCEEGYCTVGVRPPPDARPPSDAPPPPPDAEPPPDAYICPAPCTDCIQNLGDDTCVVDCSGANLCDQPIVCPAGMQCEIHCTDAATCTNTIDCSMSTVKCAIDCAGMGSCAGAITCPANERCDVTCDGENSCTGGVACSTSCACDVVCNGTGSCTGTQECVPNAQDRCEEPPGCSSTNFPQQCDNC